jgi:regulator of sigma E protease
MDFWIKAAQLILSLSILIVLHEFGHFIPARLFKTRVEKFYLFFNPWFSLVRTKKVNGKRRNSWFSKETPKDWAVDPDKTEWGLGWLPLGGYVKIAGMIDESMDKEQLAQPAQPWEFRSKKAWQRLIIMIGGVVVNLIVGVLIYILVMFGYGEEQLKPSELTAGVSVHPYLQKYGLQSGDNILAIDGEEIDNIQDINKSVLLRGGRALSVVHADGKKETITLPEDIDYELFEKGALPIAGMRSNATTVDSVIGKSPAEAAGLRKGDKIISVNAHPIAYYDVIQRELYNSKSKKVDVVVDRLGKRITLQPTVKDDGTIGFVTNQDSAHTIDYAKIKTVHYSFGESIGRGFDRGIQTLTDYAAQLKFLFTEKGATSIGGFATIGNLFPAEWDWQRFWENTAFISIILAFMNILPIPALDGGHVIFLLYEIITRREAPQKVLEYAQYIGFFLLMGLLIYANGNDIFKWLFGG